jgi:hypothetical protein
MLLKFSLTDLFWAHCLVTSEILNARPVIIINGAAFLIDKLNLLLIFIALE